MKQKIFTFYVLSSLAVPLASGTTDPMPSTTELNCRNTPVISPHHSFQASLENENIEDNESIKALKYDPFCCNRPHHCREKKICSLCVKCLWVNGTLIVNGVNYGNLESLADALIAAGLCSCRNHRLKDIHSIDSQNGAETLGSRATVVSDVVGMQGYGYVYNTSAQFLTTNDSVVFDNNGLLRGIVHAPKTSNITVSEAGEYSITFVVTTQLLTLDSTDYTIYVNGTPVSATNCLNPHGNQSMGQAILSLAAGDIITLVHTGSGSDLYTPSKVNASILIVRLS